MKTLSLVTALLAAGVALGCCGDPPPSPEVEPWMPTASEAGDEGCTGPLEFEPNDAVVEANTLGNQEACTTLQVTGRTAAGADVYYLWGDSCEGRRPTATLKSGPEDARVCLFVYCEVGKTGLDPVPCPGSTTALETAEGILGCCSTGGGPVQVNANCDSQYAALGKAPSFDAFVAVDRGGGGSCEEYTVDVSL